MNLLLVSLTVINFLGLIYLTFLIYKKNLNIGKKTSDATSSAPLSASSKISLTRFNPFDEIGGDQSFILCLLDNTNSGVIITSLHNRDFTRLYAKQVVKGDYTQADLSKEEKQALKKVINS